LIAKPLGEFGPRKNSTDGLNGHCRKCVASKNKKWKKENPIKYLCSMMLAQAKRRAADYGRDFNLTLEDVLEVVVVECPVLKTPLRWEYQHGLGQPDERSPSLDRIDNSRGYIKGNIAIISHRANSIKNCLTINQIKSLLEYVSLPQQGAVDQLRPVVKKTKYTQMSQEEMQLIRDLHSKGWSYRKIAAVVTQSKSSIAAFIRQERPC
jgi:hypothetical protein